MASTGVDLASVLGQVASQTRHEGASFAQRTLCTLSVARRPSNVAVAYRSRESEASGEMVREVLAKQIGPVPSMSQP